MSAICAASALALTPATGRVETVFAKRGGIVSLDALGSIASFTPVTVDQRLARAYAQARVGAASQGFRFTPSVGSMSGRRSITIVVRAPSLGIVTQGTGTQGRASQSSALGLGPVAYNLGAARGLERFAVESTASAEAEPLVPASALAVPRGFSLEKHTRFAPVVPSAEGQAGNGVVSPTLFGDRGSAVELGSSYSLTRNLDVTAGVRYRARQNRPGLVTDDAQDNKAVYLGTTFKF